MVLVLCLNAAIDKTAVLRRLIPHRCHRLDRTLALPGGKGINVARALRRLGERPLILGFTAGHAGRFIEDRLREEGLAARWVRLPKGESRTCLSLLNGKDGPTELNETGPRVGRAELGRLMSLYLRLARRSRLIVLSGSLPLGCPEDTYARLIRAAKAAGRSVLLDTSGPALARALAARPKIVKVNREEAASLGLRVWGEGNYPSALEGLRRRGAGSAIITLGAQGAVASLEGRLLRVVLPPIRAVTPIGCGDTFLAALARSLLKREKPEAALAYAAAVATASARVLGAGVFRLGDVPPILRRVAVKPLQR